MNKTLCWYWIKKGSWSKTFCAICRVRNKTNCQNLKYILAEQQAKEEKEFEERTEKFDERRDFIKESATQMKGE